MSYSKSDNESCNSRCSSPSLPDLTPPLKTKSYPTPKAETELLRLRQKENTRKIRKLQKQLNHIESSILKLIHSNNEINVNLSKLHGSRTTQESNKVKVNKTSKTSTHRIPRLTELTTWLTPSPDTPKSKKTGKTTNAYISCTPIDYCPKCSRKLAKKSLDIKTYINRINCHACGQLIHELHEPNQKITNRLEKLFG